MGHAGIFVAIGQWHNYGLHRNSGGSYVLLFGIRVPSNCRDPRVALQAADGTTNYITVALRGIRSATRSLTSRLDRDRSPYLSTDTKPMYPHITGDQRFPGAMKSL